MNDLKDDVLEDVLDDVLDEIQCETPLKDRFMATTFSFLFLR